MTATITVIVPRVCTEPPDTAPAFVAAQSYTVGEAIATLTLPAARADNGTMPYSLWPSVPGLMFVPVTRTLRGPRPLD